jgi:hypothetical protein
MKKKLREFFEAFCWLLALDLIFSNLGIKAIDAGWLKYLGPAVLGLLGGFIFYPTMRGRN